MKKHLITGNVIETIYGEKGIIVNDRVFYQNGWDFIDEIESEIEKIYEAPAIDEKSWHFGIDDYDLLQLVWQKPTITEVEKAMLENVKKRYGYIARDLEGSLWIYESKPYKNADESRWESDSWCCRLPFNNIFKMVQWEDEEPSKISDLIGE